MTVVYSVQPNLSTWASQVYALGARVSTGGNAYQCIVPGSSTSAPTGNFGRINNGGVAVWKWLSVIDFTSIGAVNAGIPTTWTDNIIISMWNNGAYTTTSGVPIIILTGHTTNGFTLTFQPAPGEGYRDALRDNNFPLAFDVTKGVGILLPSTGAGNTLYFTVQDPGVTIKGIQYKDPNSGSSSIPYDISADNFTMVDCLLDTFTQPSANGGMVIESATVNWAIINSVFIDRQTVGANAGQLIQNNNGGTSNGTLVNNTFVSVTANSTTQAVVLFNNNTGGILSRNNSFFGWSNAPIGNNNGFNAGVNVDHCITNYNGATPPYTDNGGNLYSKVAANQFVSAFSDLRTKKTGDGYHTGVADPTDIPTADDVAGRGRGTGPWSMGAWEPGFDTPTSLAPVIVRQEQPLQPLPRLLPAFQQPVQPVGSGVRYVFTRQEQPLAHPLPRMVQGAPGKAVRLPNTDFMFLRQQQPDHPLPWGGAGVQGPDVRVPVLDRIFAVQEQPAPRFSFLQGGPVRSGRPPVTDRIVTVREQPVQPAPFMSSGPPGASVRPPVADTIILRQQQPDHPQPSMAAGAYGQRISPPTTSLLLVRQEMPAHPLPVLPALPPGLSVAPAGMVGSIFQRQEQPAHPLPAMSGRRPDAPLAAYPLGGSSVMGRQEQPDHPLPRTVSGSQGPDVRVPVTDRVVTVQQQPAWQQPIVAAGPYGQNVRVPVTDTILLRQQQPDHPLPQLAAGPPGATVRSPTADTILLRQEQPGHPAPTVRAGVQGPNVMVRVLDSLFTVQQQPDHPGPRMLPSVQGPDVLTKVADTILVRQEQPGHPAPRLAAGVQGPNVALPGQIRSIFLRQEQPGQVGSVFGAPVQTTTFLPATIRWLFTRQQLPDHPLPILRTGVTNDRPFVIGRTIQLRADL